MPQISGKTRVVAIIGDPVAHSLSPAMHNAAFQALGLDFVYVASRVEPDGLRRAVAGIRALGFAGVNVTVPHKERIVPLLDRLTPAAKAIGAVNCIVRRGDELIGDNTDAGGFELALAEYGLAPRGRHVLVLGAGGSARAVVWTLVSRGARRITILNRTADRRRRLARFARSLCPVEVATGSLSDAERPDAVDSVDLVVNCTSLGLDGRSMPAVALAALPSHTAIYDLVYGRTLPPLVSAARRARRKAYDGRGMLLHQAALAFRQWTGRRAPLDVMASVLDG